MSRDSLRLPAATLGLLFLGLAACSSKSTDTSGMSGTIAPAARVEEAQVEAKDVKVEEPAPPAKDETSNKDVDATLTGSKAAAGHSSNNSSNKSVLGHSSNNSSNRSSNIIP